MTDIFDRMIKLAKMLGMDTSPSGKSMAEFKGYAAGLEMVFDDMAELERQVYPLTASGKALGLLCNQLGIDGDISDNEKYSAVEKGFGYVFGDYANGSMAAEFEKYGISCVGTDGRIELESATFTECGVLENMGRIFRNFLSPATEVVLSGDGLDFDFWDNTQLSFDNYDRLDIPFYILDKLK